MKGSGSRARRTREAVTKQMPSVMKGEWTGRGSKRSGWLHTLRSCISTLMTLMKCPLARVALVLPEGDTGRFRGGPGDAWGRVGTCHPPGLAHEVVIEVALALGEAALEDVLVLLGHLLLHVHLQPAQQEGAEHLGEQPVSCRQLLGFYPPIWG